MSLARRRPHSIFTTHLAGVSFEQLLDIRWRLLTSLRPNSLSRHCHVQPESRVKSKIKIGNLLSVITLHAVRLSEPKIFFLFYVFTEEHLQKVQTLQTLLSSSQVISYIFVTLSSQDHLILNIELSTALKQIFLCASVFPLVLTICWVTGMMMTGSGAEVECWDDYSDSSIIYIIVTPMILALTVTNITGNFVTCNSYFVTGQSWNSD